MASIPLPALAIQNKQEDPLAQYAKIVQLKSALQQQQQEQQLAPLRVQQAQQSIQSGQLGIQRQQQENQILQFDINDKQGIANALKDVYAGGSSKAAGSESPIPNASGTTPSAAPIPSATGAQPQSSPLTISPPSADRFSDLLTRIQDPKYGISPMGQMQLLNSVRDMQQKSSTLTKTQIENQEAVQKQIGQHLTSVLSATPENQPYQYQIEANAIRSNPLLAQFAQQLPAQYPGQEALTRTAQGIMIGSDFTAWQKQQNEAPGQVAESTQKVSKAAAPNPQQISDATQTLGAYNAIPQNMRAGLANEIKNAPDVETLQKVQARADAANESFQRSADARQQAMALKDVGLQQVVAGKLVGEDQKLGTALDQTNGIRQLLDMSKGGNQQATAAAQVRFAEHEIVEGGVKRLNQTELEGLTSGLGSYGREFKAWADKGFEGKMPPATNAEMQTILDAEDKNSNVTHERNVGYITNRYAPVQQNKTAPKSNSLSNTNSSDPFAAFGGKAHPQ